VAYLVSSSAEWLERVMSVSGIYWWIMSVLFTLSLCMVIDDLVSSSAEYCSGLIGLVYISYLCCSWHNSAIFGIITSWVVKWSGVYQHSNAVLCLSCSTYLYVCFAISWRFCKLDRVRSISVIYWWIVSVLFTMSLLGRYWLIWYHQGTLTEREGSVQLTSLC
jgi:hypothetical protein